MCILSLPGRSAQPARAARVPRSTLTDQSRALLKPRPASQPSMLASPCIALIRPLARALPSVWLPGIRPARPCLQHLPVPSSPASTRRVTMSAAAAEGVKQPTVEEIDALRASIAQQGELVKTLKKSGAAKVRGRLACWRFLRAAPCVPRWACTPREHDMPACRTQESVMEAVAKLKALREELKAVQPADMVRRRAGVLACRRARSRSRRHCAGGGLEGGQDRHGHGHDPAHVRRSCL